MAVDIPVYENLLAPLLADDATTIPVDAPAVEEHEGHEGHEEVALPTLVDPLELYDVDEPFGTIVPEPPPA